MKSVVLDLLRQYLQVETQFQQGKGGGGSMPRLVLSDCLLSRPSLSKGGSFSFPSSAHYDKCVISLREQYMPNMTPVLECIFSHAQVAKKNLLVTMLIVSRKGEAKMIDRSRRGISQRKRQDFLWKHGQFLGEKVGGFLASSLSTCRHPGTTFGPIR